MRTPPRRRFAADSTTPPPRWHMGLLEHDFHSNPESETSILSRSTHRSLLFPTSHVRFLTSHVAGTARKRTHPEYFLSDLFEKHRTCPNRCRVCALSVQIDVTLQRFASGMAGWLLAGALFGGWRRAHKRAKFPLSHSRLYRCCVPFLFQTQG